MSVLIDTTLGHFTVDLWTDEAPKNCLNFLKLAKLNYYSFCNFYFIQKDFIASCSDRLSSDASGSGCTIDSLVDPRLKSSHFIQNEFHPKLQHSLKGTFSILSLGTIHRNRSSFFITLADNLNYLDEQHTAIGRITKGLEIVDKLNSILVDTKHRPFEDVVIKRIYVLHDPFPDPSGYSCIPVFPGIPSVERTKMLRINWIKKIEQEKLLTPEQLKKRQEQREMQAKALTLEILGDIPIHDITPADNILFVCKLNLETREDDLKLVFSRFGPIKKCNIVRDRKTRQSLGYAFVEFEQKEACEEAYLKMENYLIDGRRIHVDFSQSVH